MMLWLLIAQRRWTGRRGMRHKWKWVMPHKADKCAWWQRQGRLWLCSWWCGGDSFKETACHTHCNTHCSTHCNTGEAEQSFLCASLTETCSISGVSRKNDHVIKERMTLTLTCRSASAKCTAEFWNLPQVSWVDRHKFVTERGWIYIRVWRWEVWLTFFHVLNFSRVTSLPPHTLPVTPTWKISTHS